MPHEINSKKPPLGHYVGTTIGDRWYRRYREDGFLARGLGRYWCEGGELIFRRFFIRTPVVIPLHLVTDIEVTAHHAGRRVGSPRIIVLVWDNDGEELRSGFVLSSNAANIPAAMAWLEDKIAAASAME